MLVVKGYYGNISRTLEVIIIIIPKFFCKTCFDWVTI